MVCFSSVDMVVLFGTGLCHPRTEGTVERGHTLDRHPIMGQGAAVRAQLGVLARVGAEARAQEEAEAKVQIPIQGNQMGIGLLVHEVFVGFVCEQ